MSPASFPRRFPWLTFTAVAVCTIVYADFHFKRIGLKFESLAPSGPDVWNGAYWGLLTSVFVHLEFWHLVANVCWLWVLGAAIERRVGAFRCAVFFSFAAFVSSTFQLAISGDAGIGGSGVVYAMYGLLLPNRRRWPETASILTPKIAALFNTWLVFCILIDYLKIFAVGNTAHVSGMVFGWLIGSFLESRRWRWRAFAAAGMVAASVLFLVWSPWSVAWLSVQAFNEHEARRYRTAVEYYSRIIAKDPTNAWAYENRASAFQSMGRIIEAERDMESLRRIAAGPAKK